jgi:hypothetical protein
MKFKKKYFYNEELTNNKSIVENDEPLSLEEFKTKSLEDFLEYKKNFNLKLSKVKKTGLLYVRPDFSDEINKHVNYFNMLENNIKNL